MWVVSLAADSVGVCWVTTIGVEPLKTETADGCAIEAEVFVGVAAYTCPSFSSGSIDVGRSSQKSCKSCFRKSDPNASSTG